MDTQNIHEQDTLQSFISDGTPKAIRDRYASLPAQAAEADFGELDCNVVVLDTETTGFSFNHDELTQIAAARIERGEIVDQFATFVNPGKPIPEEVARLTGIHDADVADAPSASESLAELVKFIGSAKVVAHNSTFDRTFTTRHPSGYPLLENVWIDSLDLARIALPRLTSHRLLDLVRAFGAPLSTHRADEDVAATCAVFRILLAAVAAMPSALVCAIARMATPEQWSTQVVFAHFAEEYQGANNAVGAKGQTSANLEFSIRDMRRERVGEDEQEARIDADEIVTKLNRSLEFPSREEIDEMFSEKGLVGGLYQDFEPRSEQVTMAEAVRDAFATSENLMVEAGTGVGKSMAYLVPAALTAQANNITVGVATKTNALLDQLVYHELPALAEALHQQDPSKPPLTYSPLKGYSHYPCLRRIERLTKSALRANSLTSSSSAMPPSEGATSNATPPSTETTSPNTAASLPGLAQANDEEKSQAPALAALLSFIEQTRYDDIDALKMDYRTLPRRVITTTSHDCLRRKCPYFYGSCFVHGARREAESADIVVTNHSLLCSDLLTEGGLLPAIRYWIIDEAHGTEAEARRAFSLVLSAEDLLRIANRVDDAQAPRNVFAHAERRVASSEPSPEGTTTFYALNSKARNAGTQFAAAAREFVGHMKDLLAFDSTKRGRGYEMVELWINNGMRDKDAFKKIVSLGHVMVDAGEKLITACQELVAYLNGFDHVAEAQNEIAAVAMDLKDQMQAAHTILFDAPDPYAYSATLSRKKDRVIEKFEALRLNVGDIMNEKLYARTHSVVFTSATLTVDGRFDSFENALGLNTDENSACQMLQLDSSYDFDQQMTIYVATDIPEPNNSGYLPALQRLLVGVHRAQQGSMLTLFTNRREMEKCFDQVQPQLKDDDLRLVCQKWGVSVKGLRDDFLADEHLSLFALKSFWEGFDAPGATLKGVVIPKLPFAKPTDPLSREREERDSQAWLHYTLPQAVLETKQAAGRLIRKASDTGVLILTDRRLISKGYGKTFLNSMPSHTVKKLSTSEIVAELTR